MRRKLWIDGNVGLKDDILSRNHIKKNFLNIKHILCWGVANQQCSAAVSGGQEGTRPHTHASILP